MLMGVGNVGQMVGRPGATGPSKGGGYVDPVPFPLSGYDVDMDFANGRYSGGALADLISGAGPLTIVPGMGLLADQQLTLIGAAAAVPAGTTGTIVEWVEVPDGTPSQTNILQIGSTAIGVNYIGSEGYLGNSSSGSNSITAALGTPNGRNRRYALSWSASRRAMVGNGGIVIEGTALKTGGSANYRIAPSATGVYIRRIALKVAEAIGPALRALTNDFDFAWVCMGDSLTWRNDLLTTTARSWPAMLGDVIGKPVMNGGREGYSSTQIKDRYLAHPELWGLPLIIWAGRNNVADPTTVLADIATMWATCTSPYKMVLSIINHQTEPSGNANYVNVMSINASLASTYGANYVDVRAALIADRDLTDPLDVTNAANDIPPITRRVASATATSIVGAIGPTDQAFTLSYTPAVSDIIKADGEYIQILARTGASVTSCARGYGGSTAASHAAGVSLDRRDVTHLGQNGRNVIAAQVRAKAQALSFPFAA